MQFIITMGGLGQRFKTLPKNAYPRDFGVDAHSSKLGYVSNCLNFWDRPKPFIKVGGQTVLKHLTDVLPWDAKYIFSINEDTYREFQHTVEEEIYSLGKKNFQIVSVKYSTRGPLDTVLQVLPQLNLDQSVCVSYCDYTMTWDNADFFQTVVRNQADMAIVSYTGFHPTFLGPNSYCHLRVSENGLWVIDLQEKKLYTDSLEKEWTSCGLYYFRSAEMLQQALHEQQRQNLRHESGEFYTSLAIKAMMFKAQSSSENLRVLNYPVRHFIQFGTPFDLQRYHYWYNYYVLRQDLAGPVASYTAVEEAYWRSYFLK